MIYLFSFILICLYLSLGITAYLFGYRKGVQAVLRGDDTRNESY